MTMTMNFINYQICHKSNDHAAIFFLGDPTNKKPVLVVFFHPGILVHNGWGPTSCHKSNAVFVKNRILNLRSSIIFFVWYSPVVKQLNFKVWLLKQNFNGELDNVTLTCQSLTRWPSSDLLLWRQGPQLFARRTYEVVLNFWTKMWNERIDFFNTIQSMPNSNEITWLQLDSVGCWWPWREDGVDIPIKFLIDLGDTATNRSVLMYVCKSAPTLTRLHKSTAFKTQAMWVRYLNWKP